MKRALALFAVLALCSVTLAQAAKIRERHDTSWDFSKVKTWKFKADKGPGVEDIDLRVRAEVRTQLAKKGLRELKAGDEGSPDVLVVYSIGGVDTLTAGMTITAGWYGDIIAMPGAESRMTAGILLEMQDPAQEKAIWAASYVMTGNSPNTLAVMRDKVEKAVQGTLKKYPPK